MRSLRVPPHTLRWYAEGAHCVDPQNGDLVLVAHSTFLARVIRFGQRLLAVFHPEYRGFTWANHSALVRFGDDGFNLSEMGPRGHERRDLKDYQAKLYCVVHFEMSGAQVETVTLNDYSCKDIEYGFAQYPPMIFDCFTGGALWAGWGDAMICSTHTTECLMGGGLWPDVPAGGVFPARQAMWVGALH